MFKIKINNIYKNYQQKPICFSPVRSSSYARDDQSLLETIPPKSADILQKFLIASEQTHMHPVTAHDPCYL